MRGPANIVRPRLRELARARLIPEVAPYQFSTETTERLAEYALEPQPLTIAQGTATLDVRALWNKRRKHLHAYTVAAEGKRPDGTTWVIAVHLSDDLKGGNDRHGSGACGHAAIHVHVGPDFQQFPSVRVPFPALGLGEALDWVVSQVVTGFETAPWSAFEG